MFLSQRTFLMLHDKVTRAEQEASTLREQNRALQVTMDWMRVRVSQLEHERATMLDHFMNIKINVPEITQAPSPHTDDLSMKMLEYSKSLFNDMGDEQARALGIRWDNATGEIATN